MRNLDFLSKLKEEGNLRVVEPSKNICESYLEKSDKSLKAAHILIENDLYEDSISKSYYAVYKSLTALLHLIGIKCENHAGSIVLFKLLFDKDLAKEISYMKKKRIDTDYYVSSEVTKKESEGLYEKAEKLQLKLKQRIQSLSHDETERMRSKVKNMLR